MSKDSPDAKQMSKIGKKEKKTDASEKGIIEAWYTDIVAATGFWITNEYKKWYFEDSKHVNRLYKWIDVRHEEHELTDKRHSLSQFAVP